MNKKTKGIVIVIIALFIAAFGIYKSDILLSDDQKAEKLKESQLAGIEKTKFKTLNVKTMDELDAKIKSGDKVIAYFAWSVNCGDARLFELNSFDNYLDNESINDMIYVIDLDKELPDGLVNHDLRKPVAKRFLIDTWTKDETVNPMELKSPQLVYYKDGKIADLVSWTVINSDSVTGMQESYTKAFFDFVKKDAGIK
ncbi:hypothetical protein [Mycoplasma sp. P36-A1]|uniref:hypothetical protein n=1 Tax=Mycoplasma sp. P36-A1 TaxID=3252900 RepID=UPI003C2D9708